MNVLCQPGRAGIIFDNGRFAPVIFRPILKREIGPAVDLKRFQGHASCAIDRTAVTDADPFDIREREAL